MFELLNQMIDMRLLASDTGFDPVGIAGSFPASAPSFAAFFHYSTDFDISASSLQFSTVRSRTTGEVLTKRTPLALTWRYQNRRVHR